MGSVQKVVGIGASLGGLNACRRVLWDLPHDFPAPILLAQHRMADSEPLLAGLLGKQDGLRVIEPDDKASLLPGTVYVAPSNYHMLVEQSRSSIALSTDPAVRYARPSIDVLFESIASFGAGAVAVVLTGASDDGARGARAVKRAGGRVIVQTPDQAESRVAPAAAISLIQPDAVVDLEEIAPLLCRWLMP